MLMFYIVKFTTLFFLSHSRSRYTYKFKNIYKYDFKFIFVDNSRGFKFENALLIHEKKTILNSGFI